MDMESGSESFVVRRSESLDAQGISKLVKRATENVFGRLNVEYIIEKANLAISLSDTTSHEILGHMALLDYPNTATVDHAEWETWMEENYECMLASAVNSLFLHLFVARDGYHQGASAEILHTVFMAVPLLQYVFLTAPHGTNLGPALEVHFTRVAVKDGATPTQDLYVTHRHRHVPMLHVRTARVEDADDLMPVFRQCSTDVNKQYGEYFLAELIESQDEDHRTIVAEVNGKAVGFVSVSTEVDVELLNACFQLEPFHSLRVPSEEKTEVPESLMSSSVKSVTISDKEMAPAQQMSTASIHKSGTLLQKSTTSMQKSTALLQKSTTAMQQKSSALLQKSTTTMQQKSSALLQKSTTSMQQKSMTSMQQKSMTSMQQKSMTLMQQKSMTSMQQKSMTSMQQKSSTFLKSATSMQKSSMTSIGGGPKSSTASQTDMEQQSSSQKVPSQQQSLVAMTEPKLQSTVSIASDSASPFPEEHEKTPEAPAVKSERKRQGCCSAVAIQLFAISERYEMRSIDFLPAIFKLFQEHDFCILTQPHNMPEFPLLTHFTRVNPRVGTTLPQELYVFHKCALLHSFAVRRVTPSDIPVVEKLVSGLEGAETVVRDVKRYVDAKRDPIEDGATPIYAAVAVCVEQIVGVAVLRQEKDIGYIRSHYNIEDFVYFNYQCPEEHGHLNHFVLNPVFAPYSKHFIKELLRLSHKSCLYYPLYASTPEGHTVISALGDMVPIRHRRQITYHVDSLGVNAPLEEVLEKRPPFALYHTNRKLTLEPKIPVNSQVVVVGSSDTAVALLQELVLSPHLRFNNITVVSPLGLPHDHANKCLPESCCYDDDSFPLMGLSTWVNTVRGKMVAINRPDQHIVVEDGSGAEALVQYDYLVLCTGTQYCLPGDLAVTENVFTVRDENEGARLLAWAKKELIPSGGSLVVYGCDLSSYTVIAALLRCGLEPSKLILVQPCAGERFNNPTVEERVQRALQEMGVVVYTGYSLDGWSGGDGLKLQLGATEPLTVECKGLVYLEGKHVDMDAFKAMNDAYLVFDRRLVIDGNHCTNDPLIFAAGPLTKFSRRYRADQWTHANFNSKEVGRKLASSLLSKLDPTANSSEHDRDLIPSFSQPKTTAAILPGGLYYLHVEKANLGERLQTLMEQPDYGQELITDTDNGYFRLHVNQYGRVQTITALSTQPIEVTNYLCLYGLHEKYLNNLLSRYHEKLIPDLFSYFREPWTCAVFHDRFPDFLEEVREYLQTPLEGDTESFEDKVRKLVEEDPEVSMEKYRAKLAAEFEVSAVKNTIRKRLFHFLHYNSHHLPMYAKPDMM